MGLLAALALLAAQVAPAPNAASPPPPTEIAPPKAYVIAEIEVTNPAGYQAYLAQVTPLVARFDGTYIVRGGIAEAREGAPPAGRMVIIAFPSLTAARAFLDSPDYAAVARIRHANARSRVLLVGGVVP